MTYLKIPRLVSGLLACVLFLAAGCAPVIRESPAARAPEPPSKVAPASPPGVPEPGRRLGPRTLASLRLTEEARLLLEAERPDDAIRILERAVALDPRNGRNYYYLAEAWIMKGNRGQALEFNRLAEIYLQQDPGWIRKVRRQKERIRR
ncbi:MAG: tetratricopeptide repeat protein [Deltaproteobacteria bacterium]|nr:tetratricopeptide repeat protein [Deltaproteobacteria bacterium]MBW2017220.1 tetratricopeptide repeat protein [Deltaproteobacteria bacterium]MBW2129294.1 tetratricopeptide repeat protein [Deltaproteobacteria bacterium]MBW2304838.1 tetratricopeptide repeat protein [Deltaproteobacteria bacterium]